MKRKFNNSGTIDQLAPLMVGRIIDGKYTILAVSKCTDSRVECNGALDDCARWEFRRIDTETFEITEAPLCLFRTDFIRRFNVLRE